MILIFTLPRPSLYNCLMIRELTSLATRFLDLIIIALTLACAALLFLWQRADVNRGTAEYARAMIDQANAWYNQIDLPLSAFEEIFSIHQGLEPEAEAKMLERRVAFFMRKAKVPGLVKEIYKVTSAGSVGGSSPKVEEIGPDGYRNHASGEIVRIAIGLAQRANREQPAYQTHSLLFDGGEPYLAVYVDKSVQFILIFDRELFLGAFMDSITSPILARMELAVPGFVPALVLQASDTKVLYAARRGAKTENPYLAMPIEEGFEVPSATAMRRDPRLTDELAELGLERSFFFEMWLRGVPASSLFPSDQPSIARRGGGYKEGVYLAFLPQEGKVEGLVLGKRLPLFSLGYLAIAMLGIALLLVSRYSRGLRRLVVQQEAFVSTMTHELRTPLHVITIGSSNLADGIVKEAGDIERYGGMLKAEAQRLGRMVESILAYSGLSNRERSWQEVDVASLLEEVLAPYRVICREQRIGLEEKYTARKRYCGDAEAIRVITSNLLSNAVKHAGEGRWIRVTAQDADGLSLTVQDRGPGIPKRDLGHITEPFYRCSSTGSQHGFSKGLGLSIVKRILDVEGGKLSISSVAGKGSSFSVRLPYRAVAEGEGDA